MDIGEVRDIAQKFREAIVAVGTSGFPGTTSLGLCSFPNGCCGDACNTLATFVYEKLGVISDYAHGQHGGENGTIGSHAWLQVGETIIDITADQFNERGHSMPPVFVGHANEFYKSFQVEARPDARIPALDQYHDLRVAYETILLRVNP